MAAASFNDVSARYIKVSVHQHFQKSTPNDVQNEFASNRLVNFYKRQGHQLMLFWEFEEAEKAYRNALNLSNFDEETVLGLEIVSLFKSQTSQELGLVCKRLHTLLKDFPCNEILLLMKSNLEHKAGNINSAIQLGLKVVSINPNFGLAYTQLGYYYNICGDIVKATDYYRKSLEIYPDEALTLNNIGYNMKLMLNFTESAFYLEKANFFEPDNLLTMINLGDVYRFSGELNKAIDVHNHAYNSINNINSDIPFRGCWVMNYLPAAKNDFNTMKNFVTVLSRDEGKSLLSYSICLDAALLGDIPFAAKKFEEAVSFDKSKKFMHYFLNQVSYIEKHMIISPKTTGFFYKTKKMILMYK